jgi:hypothetical protein
VLPAHPLAPPPPVDVIVEKTEGVPLNPLKLQTIAAPPAPTVIG